MILNLTSKSKSYFLTRSSTRFSIVSLVSNLSFPDDCNVPFKHPSWKLPPDLLDPSSPSSSASSSPRTTTPAAWRSSPRRIGRGISWLRFSRPSLLRVSGSSTVMCLRGAISRRCWLCIFSCARRRGGRWRRLIRCILARWSRGNRASGCRLVVARRLWLMGGGGGMGMARRCKIGGLVYYSLLGRVYKFWFKCCIGRGRIYVLIQSFHIKTTPESFHAIHNLKTGPQVPLYPPTFPPKTSPPTSPTSATPFPHSITRVLSTDSVSPVLAAPPLILLHPLRDTAFSQ